MKIFTFCLALLLTAFLLPSCQKDFSLVSGTAQGSLKKDAGGDCLPVLINGTYKKDSLLGANNYVDVQVNITTAGQYSINTDTLNGYFFTATGNAQDTGLSTIRLQGTGRPVAFGSGVDVFHVRFDSTVCEINVALSGGTVIPPVNDDSIHVSFDGGVTYTNFNQEDSAHFDNTSAPGYAGYSIFGNSAAGEYFEADVAVPGAAVPAGTPYNVNQGITTSFVYGEYDDVAGNFFSAQTMSSNPTPYLTVTITSQTATKVTGTFTGTLYDSGTGPATKSVQGNFSETIYP